MSATPDTLSPLLAGARARVPLPSPFALQCGGELHGAHVAVETWGALDSERRNAILVFTGLSASAHAAANRDDPSPGWWEPMLGPGKPIDTQRHFVICVNSLGSCFGSTGPADIDPRTARRYGGDFPELRVEDIARSAQAVVDALHIEELAAVVGCSLGGMTALAHAAIFPGRARRLVSVSGALAPTAHAIGTRALQREIVGTSLRGGGAPLDQAMRWARKIGMLSYIGGPLLEARHGRRERDGNPGASGTRFEVESWLEYQASKFAASFEPWSYWYVSRAMDLFDFAALEPAHDALAVARRLRLERALILGVTEDLLFPIVQQREVADTLLTAGIDTQFEELASPYGHDAFLVEAALFGPRFQRFLTPAREPRRETLARSSL